MAGCGWRSPVAGGERGLSADRPLPYGRHTIEEDDIAAVAEVLRGDMLTTGPAVARFEDALTRQTGARHAIACANGTAALHLAALALNLGPGDQVVVPTMTFLATANAARYVGADVVFADVDPGTGLMRPQDLQDALTRAPRAKAVFPVHLNGQAVQMAGIAAVARSHDLAVVEDSCHALGTVANGENVGGCTHGDMACFSFHPVKTVAMGEGGAVTVNDDGLAERLRLLRSHGMVRNADAFKCPDQAFGPDGLANPWYYEMAEPGFNYRASDINCALGVSQMAKLERFRARRTEIATLYDRLFAPLNPVVRPVSRMPGQTPCWHLYVVQVDFAAAGISRGAVMRALSARGIGTQVHYLPVHRQPYYRQLSPGLALAGADAYYESCLSLPLFPAMSDDDCDRVVRTLTSVLAP
ncbi:MAG: UDP-4-amino-4,6-dideoxy-N-acetyl-beta-L-altrosamine transaminase [Magnetospirillum sp.]|nr:UDP-4-amino-4,6-dideoxy-N-acetyl-beta-L-altrosamine transaminase [Magnetospirillum sp.]